PVARIRRHGNPARRAPAAYTVAAGNQPKLAQCQSRSAIRVDREAQVGQKRQSRADGNALAAQSLTDGDASGCRCLMDSPVDLARRNGARESSARETTSPEATSRRAACPHATRAAAVPTAVATTWRCSDIAYLGRLLLTP